MRAILENITIFLIRNTFLGRGFLRKYSIKFLVDNFLNKDSHSSTTVPSKVVKISNIPFKFYFDALSNLSKFVGKDDRVEINFLKDNLPDDFVFIDIGANNGFYTQMLLAEHKNKTVGKIISIEPNPLMCERILENISLLGKEVIQNKKLYDIENCAVGESNEKAYLDQSLGYGQARLSKKSEGNITVNTRPLLDIINSRMISKIDCLKIDVEGYEMNILKPFFMNAPSSLYPNKIVIEYTHNEQWEDINFIEFLSLEYDYSVVGKTAGNILLEYEG